MKIEGLTIDEVVTGDVELSRPEGKVFVLKVRALPLGADERLARLFPIPAPPREYATKKGLVLRGEDRKPIYEERTDDPEWLGEASRMTRLMMTYVAYHGLKADPRVRFDIDPAEEAKDARAFYAKVADEMCSSGLFVAGDLACIFRRVMDLSNFDKVKFAAARDSFSDGGR